MADLVGIIADRARAGIPPPTPLVPGDQHEET
jgi:hypothetical protein